LLGWVEGFGIQTCQVFSSLIFTNK
jgi:hypothetical protein